MPWTPPGAAHARDDPGHPGHLGHAGTNGTKLDFRGDFYTHTLMTPFFTPAPDLASSASPKVFLAGVGELMTEVAGEVCDGFLCHGFTTERYLREVTLPALERGRAKAGKTMEGFEIVGPELRRHRHQRGGAGAGRRRHAPADRLLRLDAGLPRRARAARLGRPAGRAQRAVEAGQVGGDGRRSSTTRSSTPSPSSASPSRSRPSCSRRYGDVISRISFYAPYKSDPERWRRSSPTSRRPELSSWSRILRRPCDQDPDRSACV